MGSAHPNTASPVTVPRGGYAVGGVPPPNPPIKFFRRATGYRVGYAHHPDPSGQSARRYALHARAQQQRPATGRKWGRAGRNRVRRELFSRFSGPGARVVENPDFRGPARKSGFRPGGRNFGAAGTPPKSAPSGARSARRADLYNFSINLPEFRTRTPAQLGPAGARVRAIWGIYKGADGVLRTPSAP